MTIRLGTIITAVVAAAALAAGWYFLAPTQLAGSTSYVQSYGTSMQPRIHAGDLVLVRRSSGYHVGEIVAYRNEQLGGHVVLHRIVGYANGRYTFKGDNNSFVDSFHPTRSELIGRMWLHVPAAGTYLVWLRGRHLILVAGAALLLVLLGIGLKEGRRRGRSARRSTVPAGGGLAALPLAAGALVLVFAGLAALAWTRPVTTTAARQGLYTQTGRFSYDAVVPDGKAVYGTTTVRTGQPLFMQLVHSARFGFTYVFASTAAHDVSGTIGLDAVVSGSSGWTRTLHVAAARPFHGDRAAASGVIAFRPLLALLKRVDSLGNVNGGTYTVTLTPRVHVHGAAAGAALDESFSPHLALLLDQNQLQLQPGSATGPAAAAALTQTTSGAGTVVTGNELSLLKLHLGVQPARRVSLYGGGAALVLLLGSLLLWRRGSGADERDDIRRAYGDLIVDVAALPAGSPEKTVQPTSFDGLARVAELAGKMIMHAQRGGLHMYMIEDAGTRYVYGGIGPDEAAPDRPLRVAQGA